MKKIIKLNVGIIGLGVGLKHLKAFSTNRNTNIYAVCDINKSKLNNLKKQYPKVLLTEYAKELILMKEIHIISIASYDDCHYEHIKLAIQNGKHIFIEKPMCLNKYELNQINKIRKKYPRKIISSNMVLRTNPRFLFMKKILDQKKIGKLIYGEADYHWGRHHKLSDWRSQIKNYSLILGASIHMIDLILWIIDKKPIKVHAFGNRLGASKNMINSSTFSNINLIFKNGLIININAFGLSAHPHYHSVKLFSTLKTLIHQFDDSFYINKKNLNLKVPINKPYPFKENRHKIIDSFVNKILTKKDDKFFVNFKNMQDTMTICLSAIESEKKGEKINIKYN